jgi:hypothetical protein
LCVSVCVCMYIYIYIYIYIYMSSSFKIVPEGAELLQSDGQTDMTVTVAVSNFSNGLKIH